MKRLIEKVRSSEFLTLNEALKVKVSLVMIFLLIFGMMTVPISFFEDFALTIKIVVPLVFVALFSLTFLMLILDKSRLAMHFSIYTFLGLTVYYVGGSGQLYGYLLLFITLTVIIFYQDITTYILYGGVLTAYGLYYIQTDENLISTITDTIPQLGPIIYQSILIGFFVVYLIHFILTESMNEKLNEEYLKTQKANDIFRSYTLRYTSELEERDQITPIYERADFQESVRRISLLINAEMDKKIENLEEIIEYYFFLHKQNITSILEKNNASPTAIKYAEQFNNYLINKNNDLNTVLFEFIGLHKEGLKIKIKRYNQHLDEMFSNKTNRILGLAMIYKFLTTEITQFDKWGRVNKILSHQEVKNLLQSKLFRDFISYEDMNFFLQNEKLFKEHL